MELSLNVNGRQVAVDADPGATLLQVLRNDLNLTGTKEGCVEGECGACTVLIDGKPVDSCLFAAHAAAGREVTTVEGVGGEAMNAVQCAMVETGGIQCGFCTPGFVMTITALLDEVEEPSREDIQTALAGNICRCTGYSQIIKAVEKAVEEMR